jgi:photosystem II stability/assembly factor-like uncharacterized protein
MVLWLGLVLPATPVLANGRFPAADQIIIDPHDSTHWLLRATFGLLESSDAGLSWSWICEGAVGYMGDPALSVLQDGGLLAGYFGAVSVSSDRGCGWNALTLDTQHQYAIDATLDPGDPTRAWVLTVSVDGSRNVSLIAVGSAGTMLESLSVGQGFVPTTVEVAPSNPERIYVTGQVDAGPSLLLRSDDRGQSWQTFSIGAYPTLPLYISAIDPNNPDLIYARVDDVVAAADVSATGSTTDAADHLLVSRDAGENWTTIFSPNTDLLGFALSPDGSRIAVGGPGKGVYLANATDLDFQLAPGKVQVLRCLRWTVDGLFACGQESIDGFTVARSTDEAQSFAPLWHVKDLKPLACGASSTTGAACPLAWPDVARTIGADPGTNANPAPLGAPDPSLSMPTPAPDKTSRSGCTLKTGAPAPPQGIGWIAVLALIGLSLVRRGWGSPPQRNGVRAAPGAAKHR